MAQEHVFTTYLKEIKACPLFDKIEEKDLLPMLDCLGARISTYAKNEMVLERGSQINKVGILLKGNITASRIDFYGNRSIVANVNTTEIFGASFALAGVEACPLDVIANCDTLVMFIQCERVTTTCCNSCSFHNQIIMNLLSIVSKNNIHFSQKIEIISKRNTRDKLLTYLVLEANKAGSKVFDIPFDRQELADYLEIERSGLSTEIGKLKKEGFIKCEKNHFELLKSWM